MHKIPKDAVLVPGERLDYDWCGPVTTRFRLRTRRLEEGRLIAITDRWGNNVTTWWEWGSEDPEDLERRPAVDWYTPARRRYIRWEPRRTIFDLGRWRYRATPDGDVIARWWEWEVHRSAIRSRRDAVKQLFASFFQKK
jgi:hypothetical protein